MQLTLEIVSQDETGPKFRQRTYFSEIKPGTIAGDAFYQVTAGVQPLTYSINSMIFIASTLDAHGSLAKFISDDYGGLFEIDQNTGILRLARDFVDAEFGQGYTIKVTALNETSGITDTADVSKALFSSYSFHFFFCEPSLYGVAHY